MTYRALMEMWQRIRELEAEVASLRKQIRDMEWDRYELWDPGC